MAEKPSTGCSGRGKLTPLLVDGTTDAPEGGPPASVTAGRTARPTRTGSLLDGLAWLGVRSTPTARAAAVPRMKVPDDRIERRRRWGDLMTGPFVETGWVLDARSPGPTGASGE